MALPELTDAELTESRKLLLRFAHIQLPDRPDLAEDLVQETMLSRSPRRPRVLKAAPK